MLTVPLVPWPAKGFCLRSGRCFILLPTKALLICGHGFGRRGGIGCLADLKVYKLRAKGQPMITIFRKPAGPRVVFTFGCSKGA